MKNKATVSDCKATMLKRTLRVTPKNQNGTEKKTGIYNFLGILTKTEADTMTKIINKMCGRVHADDWK